MNYKLNMELLNAAPSHTAKDAKFITSTEDEVDNVHVFKLWSEAKDAAQAVIKKHIDAWKEKLNHVYYFKQIGRASCRERV